MTVTVDSGRLPAMSTIAVMSGLTPEGKRVDFAADHRAGRAMIEALNEGELVEVDVEGYLVLRIADPREALVEPVIEEGE